MKSVSLETRQRMSAAAKRRADNPEEKLRRSLTLRFNLPSASIAKLYRDGRTICEIAELYGVSNKAISNNLKREGVQARKPARRDQSLHNNHMWKGENASYKAFHQRLYNLYGRPKCCTVCGTTDSGKSYDWANLTGQYSNIDDYARMCRSCHRKYDIRRRAGL